MASKVITCWLANRAVAFARREGATQADRIMAICLQSYYVKMIRVMDESEHIMTERDASEFHKLCLKHLKAYVWLHQHGMKCDRGVPGRRCWLLLPKLHHLWHLAWDTLQTRLNPRTSQLLSAESFVGEIGRIAKATHRSNLSQRTLERYLAKLSLKVGEIVKKC